MTAHEFWLDLLAQFGENAKAVAFAYLDTITAQSRIHGDDPEELLFCCDLFSIISAQ